jgi:hypothetical protein
VIRNTTELGEKIGELSVKETIRPPNERYRNKALQQNIFCKVKKDINKPKKRLTPAFQET